MDKDNQVSIFLEKLKKINVNFYNFYERQLGSKITDIITQLLQPVDKIEIEKSKNSSYFIDHASKIVAEKLFQDGDNDKTLKILDMCAAPGGKSLVLLKKFNDCHEFIFNEISTERRLRLLKNLSEFYPQKSNYKVTGSDATQIGIRYPNSFDRILLDAPCSSEAHILQDETLIKDWTPGRVRKIVSTQYALLCSALLALKPGGILIYSTCSINPEENEQMVKKILMKKSEFLDPTFEVNSQLYLPITNKMGPMFYALFKKDE